MKRVLAILFFALVSSAMAQQKAPQPSPSPPQSRGVPTIKVWVDTAYGFYHCPNTKLYGKTKQGVYMTQKQAQDRGYRPAYGTFCNTIPKAPSKTAK
ncbi:MAG TPA: hypothetical protein VKB02_15520 [Pyrinomonadaceae bacterium]|nr:hypothetical protein [Pyrinomonadaceae bacterium]